MTRSTESKPSRPREADADAPRRRIGVCTVVNSLEVGGLEKVVLSLYDRLDRDEFDLSLVCLSGQGKLFGELSLPAGSTLVLDKPVPRLDALKAAPGLVWAIRGFLAERAPDVVHGHNMAPLLYGGVCARLLGVRRRPAVVYSEHNQLYSATPAARKRFSFYVRLADQVVAVSRDLEHALRAEVGVRQRVRVIYNGIDGTRFRDEGPALRRELGLGEDDLVAGTAVVLSEQKGVAFLLEAARAVVAAEPRARFVIAGEGPLRAELEARATALGLGERVRFLGYRRDVPALISALDVYVLPSLWEGLPLALLEALAIGKPIVCTSVGGNPEIVDDGVNGFVVPPRDPAALADRLLAVLRDPAFRAAARDRNRRRFAETFSLDQMVSAHAALYRELARAG